MNVEMPNWLIQALVDAAQRGKPVVINRDQVATLAQPIIAKIEFDVKYGPTIWPTGGHSFSVVQQVWPEPHDSTLFRVIESYPTIDGPRSRLTNKVASTKEQLIEALEKNCYAAERKTSGVRP